MAALLIWSDAACKRLLGIAVISLCAVGMLPHVRAGHLLPDSVPPPNALPEAEPSLFLASGGLVPDSDRATVGAR